MMRGDSAISSELQCNIQNTVTWGNMAKNDSSLTWNCQSQMVVYPTKRTKAWNSNEEIVIFLQENHIACVDLCISTKSDIKTAECDISYANIWPCYSMNIFDPISIWHKKCIVLNMFTGIVDHGKQVTITFLLPECRSLFLGWSI